MTRKQTLWTFALTCLLPAATFAQIRDQVVIYGITTNSEVLVLRYGRGLTLLGSTDINDDFSSLSKQNPIVVDAQGRYTIAYGPGSDTKLLRMGPDGQLLPPALLNHNPVYVSVARNGDVFALTRIGWQAPGPMYGFDSAGSLLWINNQSPFQWWWYPPTSMVTAGGDLWIGGDTPGVPTTLYAGPMMKRIDPATGAELETFYPPPLNLSGDSKMSMMRGAPDGTWWVGLLGSQGWFLYNYSGTTLLNKWPNPTGFTPSAWEMYVDAAGDIWAASTGGGLYRYGSTDGALLSAFQYPGAIKGFALGPSGEDVFVFYGLFVGGEAHFRLARTRIATGITSSVTLVPPLLVAAMGVGDPTGFVFANVIDQDGDNDGDGFTNRQETLAGSSPYDKDSVPTGPKAMILFTTITPEISVLSLKLYDPDGILHPTSGIDPWSLSLMSSQYGEILPALLPFVSGVQLSADGKEATIDFGLLPLPSNAGVDLTLSVKDRQGAVGWDWQITPPGDA